MRCLLFLAVLAAPAIFAQPKFEVATIKPSPTGGRGGGVRPAPGGERYIASNITLKTLIAVAYRLKPEQISGGPAWIDTDRYDMNAKAERASSLEQLHAMLRNLLSDRFKLQFHQETKEIPVYILTAGKGDPKLTAHDPQNAGDTWIESVEKPFLHVTWNARFVSMDYFAWRLSQILDRPVVNQTKLTGGYDFDLTFTRALPPDISPDARLNGEPIDISGPSVFEAVRRQLNLNLASQKALAQIIFIDRAEHPAEN